MKIVLLPGMDGTGRLYEPFNALLGAKVSLLVLRYPVAQVLGYAELEHWVRARLPQEEPFVLLAESFSGPIGIAIASQAPAGLRGLILCCSFARNPHPALSVFRHLVSLAPVNLAPTWFANSLLMGHFATASMRQTLADALSEVQNAVMRERMKAVLAVDVTDQLATVTLPTLYLQARHDRVLGPAPFEHVKSALPTVELASLEGPHMLLQTQPDAAARVILTFVERVCRPGDDVSEADTSAAGSAGVPRKRGRP